MPSGLQPPRTTTKLLYRLFTLPILIRIQRGALSITKWYELNDGGWRKSHTFNSLEWRKIRLSRAYYFIDAPRMWRRRNKRERGKRKSKAEERLIFISKKEKQRGNKGEGRRYCPQKEAKSSKTPFVDPAAGKRLLMNFSAHRVLRTSLHSTGRGESECSKQVFDSPLLTPTRRRCRKGGELSLVQKPFLREDG